MRSWRCCCTSQESHRAQRHDLQCSHFGMREGPASRSSGNFWPCLGNAAHLPPAEAHSFGEAVELSAGAQVRGSMSRRSTQRGVSLGLSAAGHGDIHVLSAVHEPTRHELTTLACDHIEVQASNREQQVIVPVAKRDGKGLQGKKNTGVKCLYLMRRLSAVLDVDYIEGEGQGTANASCSALRFLPHLPIVPRRSSRS